MHGPPIAILLALLVGCPPADDDDSASDPVVNDDDDDATEAPALEPTWTSLHPEFVYRCTCHKTSEGGEGNLTGFENADLAWAVLVGVPSVDLPTFFCDDTAATESSYSWLKIQDTHLAAGGLGDRMPPTGPGLSDELKGVIREWIELGALND